MTLEMRNNIYNLKVNFMRCKWYYDKSLEENHLSSTSHIKVYKANFTIVEGKNLKANLSLHNVF